MPVFSGRSLTQNRSSGYAVWMSAIRNITGSTGVFTRSRLIIGLLVLILVLVLGMAWQANRSVQAHNDTAIGVLQDYARTPGNGSRGVLRLLHRH